MKKKFVSWLRRKLYDVLQLPETYIAADVHVNHPSEILVMRFHPRDRKWEVIGDYYSENKTYCELLRELEHIAKRYNVEYRNIVMDNPPGLVTRAKNCSTSWKRF